MRVIVNMACGLANRMFQYSYYLYLRQAGYDACVDYYRTAKLKHEHVRWNEIFPHAPICQAAAWEVLRTGGGADLLSKIRRRYLGKTCRILFMPSAFDALLPRKDERGGGPLYVNGVFQNAGMVEQVREQVQAAFAFVPFTDKRNIRLQQEMQSCQSVAIHVRKGNDYRTRPWYAGTCPAEYYRKAVALLRERLGEPRFYVFTDNPDWVRANFSDFAYTLVDGNPTSGPGSHFDMQLMSSCRHNIISNSTYSWWGAFLNPHPGKSVVLPAVWFNPESCEEYTSGRVCGNGWLPL